MRWSARSRFSLFFFFSSRRRHTRLQGDWSSDVCSSDLGGADQQTDIQGEIAGLRPVVPPLGADAKAIEYHQGAEKEYDDSDTDFHGPDRCRRTLLLAFHPLLDPPVPQSGALDALSPRVHPILPRQESRFLHEHDMPRLLARHPGLVFFSAQ